jgi:hypothetical protein
MITAILLMAASPTADGNRWSQLQTAIEAAPKDLATFIERRTACNHWDGEVGSGYVGRERQIQNERKKLRCDNVEADERALRKEYRHSPALLKLLDETEDMPPS